MIKSTIVLSALVGLIRCALTKEETMALNRDGMYRPNPDELFDGFFAVWPVILLIMAGAFLVMTLVGFLGYASGICKGKEPKRVTAFELD